MTDRATPCLCKLEYVLTGGPEVGPSDAHRFYAWLLSQLPDADAEWLHESGGQLLCQNVRKDRETGQCVWSVGVLSREANDVILPILEKEIAVALHSETIKAVQVRREEYATPAEFIRFAKEHPVERVAQVSLQTPLAFHQQGKCVIYPEVRLLLQSLANKWNAVFPEFSLDDADAMAALENGVMIRDYQLRTVRFALKGNKIPGCIGKLYLQSRLPEPLFEIWSLLLRFGAFSGAGIKTTLGMGALDLAEVRSDI